MTTILSLTLNEIVNVYFKIQANTNEGTTKVIEGLTTLIVRLYLICEGFALLKIRTPSYSILRYDIIGKIKFVLYMSYTTQGYWLLTLYHALFLEIGSKYLEM